MTKAFCIFVGIIVFIIIVGMMNPKSTGKAPAPMPRASSALELSDDIKDKLAFAINGSGFNCPTVLHVYARGENHFGKVFRVRCASDTGRMLTFKIVLQNNDNVLVAPWE